MPNYQKTHKLINDNLDTLNNLAKALLERETLNGHEIEEIIGNKKRKRKPRKTRIKGKIDSPGKKN